MDVRKAIRFLAEPRVDEERVIERAIEQGVIIVPFPPDSHLVKGPAGEFFFEGLNIGSECFCNDPLGMLNITKAWRLLYEIGEFAPRRLPIDEPLLGQLAGIDIEERTLRKMTAERRSMPILLALDKSNTAYLIDGAHRLFSRAQHGKKWIDAFLLDSRALAFISAKLWQLNDDGTRREIDTTKGHWSVFGAGSPSGASLLSV